MRVPAKIHLLHPLFSHEDDFSWRNYWHVFVLLMVSLLLFINFTYTFLSLAYGQTLSPSADALKQGILQPHESRSTSSVLPISTTDPLGKMAFSSDGQTIVFSSRQEDLVAGDSNGEADVFLYEPHKDLFSCVTCQINGLISNGRSLYPRISADGRRVVFLSYASNLVENDEANTSDVFLYERSNHLIQRVSQKNEGDCFEAELSANGQYVVYTVRMVSSIKNESDNKSHIMRVDLNTGKREVISSAINGIHSSLSASAPST